jgi:hypothetical protein
MPALEIFSSSAFSMVALTDAINHMPFVPGRIGTGVGRELPTPARHLSVVPTWLLAYARRARPCPNAPKRLRAKHAKRLRAEHANRMPKFAIQRQVRGMHIRFSRHRTQVVAVALGMPEGGTSRYNAISCIGRLRPPHPTPGRAVANGMVVDDSPVRHLRTGIHRSPIHIICDVVGVAA